MVFKTATPKDTEIILSILYEQAVILKSKNIYQWRRWLSPSTNELNWLNNLIDNEFFFLIYDNNSIVGIFSLANEDTLYWGKQGVKAKYLHSLAIIPNSKNKGLGKKAIDSIKIKLKSDNIPFLRLDCISTNQSLKSFYLNQNFIEVGTSTVRNDNFSLFEFEL